MKKYLTEKLLNHEPYKISDIDKKKLFFDALKQELIFHYNNNKEYSQFCDKKKFDPNKFNGEAQDTF